MSWFVFVYRVLFWLCFILNDSEGAITSPLDGTQYVFLPGKTAKIKWKFNDPISSVRLRSWFFTSSDGSLIETLAEISRNDSTVIETRSFDVDIEKPSTLVLKNVNESYNGEYQFTLTAIAGFTSSVTVSIAKKPTVTLNCSSATLNEDGDFICECKGQGGNPPANVTWYKDDVQIGETSTEKQLLILKNVDEADRETYKCVAESYPDPLYRDEESITLVEPTDTSIQLSPNPTTLSQSFTITCSSRGLPKPTYKIFHNGINIAITTQSHTINNVAWSDAGEYACKAVNGVGSQNASRNLEVTEYRPITTTQKSSTPNTSEKSISNKSCKGCDGSGTVVVWHIVVTLLSGIMIGILFSYIVSCSLRRWFKNRKLERNSEPQTDGVDTTYQELDLTKMNKEDNYQSLRGNVAASASNDAANDEESTYTQLSKTRDVEDNYQSLT